MSEKETERKDETVAVFGEYGTPSLLLWPELV